MIKGEHKTSEYRKVVEAASDPGDLDDLDDQSVITLYQEA